jgi:hypothetical protein
MSKLYLTPELPNSDFVKSHNAVQPRHIALIAIDEAMPSQINGGPKPRQFRESGSRKAFPCRISDLSDEIGSF